MATQLTEQQSQELLRRGLTPQQIQRLTTSDGQTAKPRFTEEPLTTLASSGGALLSDLWQVVRHPIRTADSLAEATTGLIDSLLDAEGKIAPGLLKEGETVGNIGFGPLGPIGKPFLGAAQDADRNKEAFEAMTGFFKDRYGSIEALKETMNTDPVGFMLDLSVVTGAARGGLRASSRLAGRNATRVPRATRGGRIASDVLRGIERGTAAGAKGVSIIDPISGTRRLAGAARRRLPSRGPRVGATSVGEVAQTNRAAQALGIELPASARTTSQLAQNLEALAAKGIFSGKVRARLTTAIDDLGRAADDIVTSSGTSPNLTRAGKSIDEALRSYRDGFIEAKKDLYSFVKGNPAIELNDTTRFLDDLIKQERIASELTGQVGALKLYENLRTGLGRVDTKTGQFVAAPTLESARIALQKINKMIKNRNDVLATGENARLKKLAATLGDDIDRSLSKVDPELAVSLKEANDFFREGITLLDEQWVRAIARNADRPEQIFAAVIKPKQATQVKTVMRIIGPDAAAEVRAVFLENLFTKLRPVGTEGKLNAQAFSRELARFGDDTVRSILTAEQYAAVKNVEKVAHALDRAKGLNVQAFTGQTIGELGTLFFAPALGLQVILGDAAFTQFIGSKAGQALLSRAGRGRAGAGRISGASDEAAQFALEAGPLDDAARGLPDEAAKAIPDEGVGALAEIDEAAIANEIRASISGTPPRANSLKAALDDVVDRAVAGEIEGLEGLRNVPEEGLRGMADDAVEAIQRGGDETATIDRFVNQLQEQAQAGLDEASFLGRPE